MAGRAVIVLMVVILAFFIAAPTQALTLIPPSLEIALTPGQSSKTIIKLYNETQNKLELYTEVRGFTAKGETGQPEFDFTGEPIGLSKWTEIEKGPIVLEPGQRREVPVTFNPPADADPGGHYATVFFSSTPPEEGQVRISSKVGTLLLARVAGAIEEEGKVSQFGLTESTSVFTRLPIGFYVKFNNTGNVHLRPTGTITITSMFGKEAGAVEVNASRGATLPQTTRKYEATWEKGQVRGSRGSFLTQFFDEYVNEKNNFALGKYTAQLAMTVGSSSRQETASVSLWVIPWHILTVWAPFAVLVVIVLIFLIKRYNYWIVRKAETQKK